jgi:hypothetical protein
MPDQNQWFLSFAYIQMQILHLIVASKSDSKMSESSLLNTRQIPSKNIK